MYSNPSNVSHVLSHVSLVHNKGENYLVYKLKSPLRTYQNIPNAILAE
jgi:hypothetical protein